MALAARSLFALFLAVAGLAVPAAATSASLVGVNYGRVADNIPPPENVPAIVASIGVGRVRIYDADPRVLHAFANTGIEVIVDLPDRCLPSMAVDPNEALVWVRANIQVYLPATKIAAVMVGNEILTNANDTGYVLARNLVPSMENIHSALASLGLDGTVAVTTSHSLSVLAIPSYPPSATVFRREVLAFICPLIDFHARTGSPFFINAYPYFAYEKESSQVALEYARLDPGAASITDPGSGLCYTNLLYAQIDAVYHAIAAARGDSAKRVMVWVSETGWPSDGDPNEIGATPENASKYNSNLIRLVVANNGTPLMPGTPLRAYIFALFNENQKPGPTSERNYGLFKADGTPAYHLDITVPLQNDTSSGVGSDGGSSDGSTLVPGGGSSGYFSISYAAGMRSHWQGKTKVLVFAMLAAVVYH